MTASKVVFECGSYSCKIGFNDEAEPTHIPSYNSTKELIKHHCELIKDGMIVDWPGMKVFMEDVYSNVLEAKIREHSIVSNLSEYGSRVSGQYIAKWASVLFEEFKVPGLFLANSAALASYSTYSDTALVVDIGEFSTTTTPVVWDSVIHHGIITKEIGGANISNCLGWVDPQINVQHVKESFCVVNAHSDCNDDSKAAKVQYILPDGATIEMDPHNAPEELFRHHYGYYSFQQPIQDQILESIRKANVPKEIREKLFSNIIVCGGSSLFPGLKERLLKELCTKGPEGPSTINIKMAGNNAVWKGGAMLASLPSFESIQITRDEYEEEGPNIILPRSVLPQRGISTLKSARK